MSGAAPHGSLASASVDAAAAVVRRLLVEEGATALTVYDADGIYGHVDHVRVHEIGTCAVAGTDCELYEATVSRPELRRLRRELVGRGLLGARWPPGLSERLGVEGGPDLVGVDVRRHLPLKLAAVSAHSSQVMEADSFMGLPAGAFHHLFATEWFRVARAGRGRFLNLVAPDVVAGPSPAATLGSAWPPRPDGPAHAPSGGACRRPVADRRLDTAHLAPQAEPAVVVGVDLQVPDHRIHLSGLGQVLVAHPAEELLHGDTEGQCGGGRRVGAGLHAFVDGVTESLQLHGP